MAIQKESWSFSLAGIESPVAVTRWGHYGVPLVLFASAGGDSIEPERLQLLPALTGLIESGRIKLYALEGSALRMVLAGTASPRQRLAALRAFQDWLAAGLVPLVRRDCHSDTLEALLAGCAFGAGAALLALLQYPKLFRGAIGLSGVYDLAPWLGSDAQAARCSPLSWLAQAPADEDQARLAQRTVMLACTAGDYEDPAATAQMASALRARGINAREDVWRRAGMNFGFASWREMLPRFVSQWV